MVSFNHTMRILGIDPGTASIGYAVIEREHPPKLAKAGLIDLAAASPQDRLLLLYKELNCIIGEWRPGAFSVEKLFFSKNTKTAFAVSEARGVILLTALLAGIRVYEYTPLEIKKTVTGDGKADKAQVEKMVRLILPEARNLKARDDVFDAIAAAYACCVTEFHNSNQLITDH